MLIGLVAGTGAPGVTTSTLALASVWPGQVLVAECDPAGGSVLAGYLRGSVEPARGLYDLVLADRRRGIPGELAEQLLDLGPGETGDRSGTGRWLLPGLTSPAHAAAVVPLWDRLGAALTRLGVPVLADCGRVPALHAPTPLLRHATTVVLVVRPTLASVAAARPRVQLLLDDLPGVAAGDQRLVALVVGDGPYPAREVGHVLDLPVIGSLPADPRAAAVYSDGATPRRDHARSALLRAARHTVESLMRGVDHAEAASSTSAPMEASA